MKVLKYLRVQIAMYYLISSLVILGLFGMTLYFSIEAIFMDESINSSEQTIDAGSSYLELYVDNLKLFSNLIANNENTHQYLIDGQNEVDTENLIADIINADDYIRTVIIVSADGRILSNEKSINMTMSENMMEEPWYVDILVNDEASLSGAKLTNFSMNKDNWVISLATQVIDEDEHIGVVIIDFDYQGIEKLMDNIDLGSEGYAYIVNSQNQIVYHPDTDYFIDENKKSELIEMSMMVDGYHQEMNKTSYSVDLEGTDWKLIGVSSLDGLAVFRRQLLETTILLLIVLLLVVLGSGYYFGGLITKPIKELEDTMMNLDQSFTNLVNEDIKTKEIKSLAVHYNQMIKKIQLLLNEINENQKYLRTYEIQALHSQINPHFLYNTLDTIVWMAEFEDSESVIEITKSLANFFRLSLSKGREVIPLRDEISHVEQYLKIQKQRYSDKLNYKLDLDDSLLDYIVPKIILQPIVENAIYYGIKEKDGPGVIDISIKDLDDVIVIKIKDDGKGIDKHKLVEINEKLIYNTVSYIEDNKSGIGLYNVQKRIQLYYGENYGISVQSVKNEGTIITIKISKKVEI
jgi:two-component system sensor histidine kinase YesM